MGMGIVNFGCEKFSAECLILFKKFIAHWLYGVNNSATKIGLVLDGLFLSGMEFINHPEVLILVGILSIPVYAMLAKVFFGDRFETLAETIKYVIWPDWYSFLKGRFWEDWDASMKFNIYLFLCFGWVAAITELLARHVL